MGREAQCFCRWGASGAEVKALLESDVLILRGDMKRRVSLSSLAGVRVVGEELCFEVGLEPVALALGTNEAARWAKKIATPPPSLRQKLGIGDAVKGYVIGSLHEPALIAALKGAQTSVAADARMAIAIVESAVDLENAVRAHAKLSRSAPIWVVHRKGRRAAFGEGAVRQTMRTKGFMDTKVAAVSAEFTATRYSRS